MQIKSYEIGESRFLVTNFKRTIPEKQKIRVAQNLEERLQWPVRLSDRFPDGTEAPTDALIVTIPEKVETADARKFLCKVLTL